MSTEITCRKCLETFILTPDKPGYRNECPECSKKVKEPEPLGGNMIWSHKTAPELEIKPMSQAKSFAKLTRRHGAGVLSSITVSREPSCKGESGAAPGTMYRSALGEARSVKR